MPYDECVRLAATNQADVFAIADQLRKAYFVDWLPPQAVLLVPLRIYRPSVQHPRYQTWFEMSRAWPGELADKSQTGLVTCYSYGKDIRGVLQGFSDILFSLRFSMGALGRLTTLDQSIQDFVPAHASRIAGVESSLPYDEYIDWPHPDLDPELDGLRVRRSDSGITGPTFYACTVSDQIELSSQLVGNFDRTQFEVTGFGKRLASAMLGMAIAYQNLRESLEA